MELAALEGEGVVLSVGSWPLAEGDGLTVSPGVLDRLNNEPAMLVATKVLSTGLVGLASASGVVEGVPK